MSFLLLILLMGAVVRSTESNGKYGLNGAHLTFAVFHVSRKILFIACTYNKILLLFFLAIKNPPYDVIVQNPNGNHTYIGSGPIWHAWLAQKLNFTYVFFTNYSHSLIISTCLNRISYRFVILNKTMIEKYGGSTIEFSYDLVVKKVNPSHFSMKKIPYFILDS